MELQTAWVDRGQSLDIAEDFNGRDMMSLVAVSRTGSASVTAPLASFWMVLRGSAEIEAREGRFHLQAGEWIAFERDSRLSLDSDRAAVVVGLVLPLTLQASLQQSMRFSLHIGRGQIGKRDIRHYLRLWREAGQFPRNGRKIVGVEARQVARLLRHVGASQFELGQLVDQCPGRSLRRKRQVFGRMQRALLFLEGNTDRPVRISELAELSNVSIWYFTKTFHALYGEGPQATASRFRLQHACELLASTRLSVSEVGAACGFENNCSFSRAFRARFGASPSLYRISCGAVAPDSANSRDIRGKAATAGGP